MAKTKNKLTDGYFCEIILTGRSKNTRCANSDYEIIHKPVLKELTNFGIEFTEEYTD
ncbi:MAG: hypothetical protein IPI46_11680 [Bacteroidetes bacterium]|nr:hypothetical protein [Bacteroidota bacterium]